MVRAVFTIAALLLGGCATHAVLVPSPIYDRDGRLVDVDYLDEPVATAMQWPLCMSGGGYRAMLFHGGVMLALNDLHLLPSMNRFSAVSGGSITQAHFALAYRGLSLDRGRWRFSDLDEKVVRPLERVATKETIDVSSVLAGLATPRATTSTFLGRSYDRVLLKKANLSDLALPSFSREGVAYPIFIFRATELGTGLPWDFTNYYMGSDELGKFPLPDIPLSTVVAASSAYPPVFSPITLSLKEMAAVSNAKYPAYEGNGREMRFLREKLANLLTVAHQLTLVDGGVYDNLGLSGCLGEQLKGGAIVSDASSLSVPGVPGSKWGWLSLSMHAASTVHRRSGQEMTARVVPLRTADIYAMATRIASLEGSDRASTIESILAKETYYPSIVQLSDVRSILMWQEYRRQLLESSKTPEEFGVVQFDEQDVINLTCLASIDTRLKAMSPASAEALINLGYVQAFATKELGYWAVALAKAYKEAGEVDGKILIEHHVGTFEPPRQFPPRHKSYCSDSDRAWLLEQISLISEEMNEDVDLESLINVGGSPIKD